MGLGWIREARKDIMDGEVRGEWRSRVAQKPGVAWEMEG